MRLPPVSGSHLGYTDGQLRQLACPNRHRDSIRLRIGYWALPAIIVSVDIMS